MTMTQVSGLMLYVIRKDFLFFLLKLVCQNILKNFDFSPNENRRELNSLHYYKVLLLFFYFFF